MAMLPPVLVRFAWDYCLQQPPITGNQEKDNEILSFRAYFANTWMEEDQIALFNHHSNSGPRTNNHAEGFNRGLASKFDNTRPTLAVFLVRLQEIHHGYQVRQRHLNEDRVSPKSRKLTYIENDQRLAAEKNQFDAYWHATYYSATTEELVQNIITYVSRCSYLLGLKSGE